MEEKCSLCARSEISSAGAIPVRTAAAMKQPKPRKTRGRRILPPIKLFYTVAVAGTYWGNMVEAGSVQFNMRQALSWLVVGLGIFVGLYRLVMAGQSSIEYDYSLSRLYVFGFFLLGFVFLVASFTALCDRRRAGIIF